MARVLTLALLASLAAPASAEVDAPVPATAKNASHHICWISNVTQDGKGDGDTALVRFRYPLAVMAKGKTGGPDKLFIDARGREEPADGSSSNPYPALRMAVGDSFTTAFGDRDSCAADLVRDDAGRLLLSVRTRHKPEGGGPEEKAGDRLLARTHTAFARELAGLAKSLHFHSYHRDDRLEYLFRMPASLEDRPDTLDRLGRINAELLDGFRAAGAGQGSLSLAWQEMGRSGDIISLVAKGRIDHGAGEGWGIALAMVENGRTGDFATDAADIFDDASASVRETYCALLDVQRAVSALHAADAAGKDMERPFDENERYLGRWPCPLPGEVAIGFAGDPGEPMHRMVLIAAPGIAGPEQEGYYTVWLNLTEEMVGHIRPDYRAAFRAAPPHRLSEGEAMVPRTGD
jgi:hypothetical protein